MNSEYFHYDAEAGRLEIRKTGVYYLYGQVRMFIAITNYLSADLFMHLAHHRMNFDFFVVLQSSLRGLSVTSRITENG